MKLQNFIFILIISINASILCYKEIDSKEWREIEHSLTKISAGQIKYMQSQLKYKFYVSYSNIEIFNSETHYYLFHDKSEIAEVLKEGYSNNGYWFRQFYCKEI